MSQPSTNGGCPSSGHAPDRMDVSTGLTPTAWTRTNTSVGSGCGRSTSAIARTSGPPKVSWLMALILSPWLSRLPALAANAGGRRLGPNSMRRLGILPQEGTFLLYRYPMDTIELLDPPNVYLRGCASRTVLEVIANKWTNLVVCSLRDGPLRFGQLRRHL